MNLRESLRDLPGWWTYYRHNTWWGKWTCPICVQWAWEDWRGRR